MSKNRAEFLRLAQDWVSAYEGEEAALARLNAHYERSFGLKTLKAEIWRRNYAFRQRSSKVDKNFLKLEEAQLILAQDEGFPNWAALLRAADGDGSGAIEPFEIDRLGLRAAPRRRMKRAEWNALIDAMREAGVRQFDANGLMTDEIMEHVASIESLVRLNLGGSLELSDDGLLLAARMPQLEHLELNEYPGGKLSDRGLQVLRHLVNLKSFQLTWQAGVTDEGVANLRYCEKLESVNLMGSPTGDGAIEALAGKPLLRDFATGRLVTDAGLRLLDQIPNLKTSDGNGAKLLVDGPFSDQGLKCLTKLEGVRELDFFWHASEMTSAGFEHLAGMERLESLACDGKLSDDVAMSHIAKIPRLKNLRAQESAATDDGFVALSASKSLEGYWGRNSEGFGSKALVAFSKMPTLFKLGVTLKNVSDEALASLADFPALRELTPIGLGDDGFRHVGKCSKLERLTCMYCRDSGDAATEHIAGLPLKYYYAGLTKITDRTCEILGRMATLEHIDFYEVKGITNTGLASLAALPNLKQVAIDTCEGVTMEGTKVFPAKVQVRYST